LQTGSAHITVENQIRSKLRKADVPTASLIVAVRRTWLGDYEA
jgi:hypothetical protein